LKSQPHALSRKQAAEGLKFKSEVGILTAVCKKNENQNVLFLSFQYFSFCLLLNILISFSSVTFKVHLPRRNHFETNILFPKKYLMKFVPFFS